jgi:hypothetical protein
VHSDQFQSAAVFLFCTKKHLQTFSRRADSPILFYFIISQTRILVVLPVK